MDRSKKSEQYSQNYSGDSSRGTSNIILSTKPSIANLAITNDQINDLNEEHHQRKIDEINLKINNYRQNQGNGNNSYRKKSFRIQNNLSSNKIPIKSKKLAIEVLHNDDIQDIFDSSV